MVMTLHRWRIKRIAGWFVPVLTFLCVLVIMASSLRSAGEGRALLSDDAYRHLVVANTLIESRTYGVHAEQPIPMVRDMLWRGAMAVTQVLFPDGLTAVRVLGMVFGVWTLLLLIQLANLIFPYPLYGYFAAALVILSPGLTSAALSGLAIPLTMCLVTAALVRHLRDLTAGGPGMPLAATCLIGLAIWVRLEFIVIWALLFVHTFVISLVPADQRPSVLNTLFRGLNGLLVLSLFLLPVLAWNMRLLNVPWPRLPGVPMAADLWALEGASVAWGAMRVLMREGWSEGYALFQANAYPASLVTRFFFWVGCILLLMQVVRSREERLHVLLLLLPLCVPFFFGIMYPYVGWNAFPIIAASCLPAVMVLAAYGVVRLPFAIEAVLRKSVPRIPTERAFAAWWIAAGGLVLILALASHVRAAREETAALRARMQERQWLTEAIERHGLVRDQFIVDRPGWLVWEHRLTVLDLEGEWTPDMLRFVDLNGTYNIERLARYVEALNPPPGMLAAWSPQFRDLETVLPDTEILMMPDEDEPDRPLIIMATWPDVI